MTALETGNGSARKREGFDSRALNLILKPDCLTGGVMKTLVDCRCPRCDRPIAGLTDVRHASAWCKTATCPYCRCNVRATEPHETDLGTEVYYVEEKNPNG